MEKTPNNIAAPSVGAMQCEKVRKINGKYDIFIVLRFYVWHLEEVEGESQQKYVNEKKTKIKTENNETEKYNHYHGRCNFGEVFFTTHDRGAAISVHCMRCLCVDDMADSYCVVPRHTNTINGERWKSCGSNTTLVILEYINIFVRGIARIEKRRQICWKDKMLSIRRPAKLVRS